MLSSLYSVRPWLLFLLLLAWAPVYASIIAEHVLTLRADMVQPTDVAVSQSGRIYVADGVNNRVVVFDNKGRQLSGFGGKGTPGERLESPMGLTVDAEYLYVANTGKAKISIFDLQGRFVRRIALPSKELPEPTALTIRDGKIIWADRRNHTVCSTDLLSGETEHCMGERGEKKNQFRFPFQLHTDSQGYVYVVDVLNARVQAFNAKGGYFMSIGKFGLGQGELYRPNGLAMDKYNRLYVSDSYFGTVSVFENGRFMGNLTGQQGELITLKAPIGMVINKDKLYVADALNNSVEVYRLGENDHPPIKNRRKKNNLSRKNCLGCHITWSEAFKPMSAKKAEVPPVADRKMCYSCHHGAVIDSRRAIGTNKQHPDIHHSRDKKDQPEREDKIPQQYPLLKDKTLYCGSCHDPHVAEKDGGTLYSRHANPWLRVTEPLERRCIGCHESKQDNIRSPQRKYKGVNHPVGTVLGKPGKDNESGFTKNKKLQKGLPVELESSGSSLTDSKRMVCQTCHQIHGADNDALTVIDTEKSALCITCHERQHAKSKEDAWRKGVHPVNIKLEEPVKLGDEEVRFITCLTCHAAHAGKRDTALLKFDNREGKLCSYCHEKYESVVDSDHDLRLTAKKSRNRLKQRPADSGVCGSCHSMHRGDANRAFLSAQLPHEYTGKEVPVPRDKSCLDCHRDKGLAENSRVKYFSHPDKDLVLRSSPASMPLIDENNVTAEFGKIGCITCHNPHHWKPEEENPTQVIELLRKLPQAKSNKNGTVQDSFLRNKGVKESFCVDCHGIEAKIRYKYYHDGFVRPSVNKKPD